MASVCGMIENRKREEIVNCVLLRSFRSAEVDVDEIHSRVARLPWCCAPCFVVANEKRPRSKRPLERRAGEIQESQKEARSLIKPKAPHACVTSTRHSGRVIPQAAPCFSSDSSSVSALRTRRREAAESEPNLATKQRERIPFHHFCRLLSTDICFAGDIY